MKPVLALSVNILDRYLSSNPIKKDKLQLLGATCLLIASKFEEIYPPEVTLVTLTLTLAQSHIWSEEEFYLVTAHRTYHSMCVTPNQLNDVTLNL